MPMRLKFLPVILACAVLSRAVATAAQTPQTPPPGSQPAASGPADAGVPGWPRTYTRAADPSFRVVVYQPQIDSWERYRDVVFRCALVVHRGAAAEPVYGSVEGAARTRVNETARLVLMAKPEFTFRFPYSDPATAAECQQLASEVLPQRESFEIGLDQMLAYVDTPQTRQREVATSLDPPPIFYSKRPAILVTFLGAPDFKPIDGTALRYAVNCNWDVIVDPATATSYLLYGESWMKTRDLQKGPWEPARILPDSLNTLPSNDQWSDVRAQLPGKPLDVIPVVFMCREPAEIIVTDGEPIYAAIPGVRLKAVTNTDAPLFRHTGDLNYYFLAAGRWFRAKSLAGPWSAATTDLPVDFKQIPRDSDWAYVLPSVAGTDEAADAVMLASVPRTATVNIQEVSLSVEYEGEPKFKPIEGTTIEGATNTTSAVFLCENKYYCCEDAVWFTAGSATGPWACARSVPDAIYAIPPSYPAHNVTYAKVLAATESMVDVGYTSGYDNALVTASVLVLGAGVVAAVIAADDVSWNVRINLGGNTITSYGSGAFYSSSAGFYCRSGNAYGPYAGRGSGATYSANRGWTRRGAASSGDGGFSMQVDTFGAQMGGGNRFSKWNRGVVASGGPSALPARGGPGGGWLESSDRAGGRRGGADGDLYAGRDGNVYRRDARGNWQQRDTGGWKGADAGARDSIGAGQRSLDADAIARGRSIAASDRASSSRGGSPGRPRGGGGRRGR